MMSAHGSIERERLERGGKTKYYVLVSTVVTDLGMWKLSGCSDFRYRPMADEGRKGGGF